MSQVISSINGILLLFLWLACQAAQAAPLDRTAYYDEENRLPHGHVTQLLQDDRGFIWIATWNGLCRFDGYDFITVKPSAGDGCHMTTDRFRDIALRPDGLSRRRRLLFLRYTFLPLSRHDTRGGSQSTRRTDALPPEPLRRPLCTNRPARQPMDGGRQGYLPGDNLRATYRATGHQPGGRGEMSLCRPPTALLGDHEGRRCRSRLRWP